MRKGLPRNLALVKKQMLMCRFIKKGLYCRPDTWNKLNYLQELCSPKIYPGFKETSKTEIFPIILAD